MGKKRDVNSLENKCRVRKGQYRVAPITSTERGSMDLLLPEIPEQELREILPPVSIVTITKDRAQFAGMMLYNWIHIKYPRDKLEWIIVDDSTDTSEYNLRDYIPQDDPYIKYHKLYRWYPVAEKRNKAVALASHEFIVHMDDDDYYFPDHVLAKVRIMLQMNCQGVHSMPIGVYDMMEGTSYVIDLYDGKAQTNAVAEATLAYRKDYWRKRKFLSDKEKGTCEGQAFIGKHHNKWVNLHFMFNMISITHSKNITGQSRRLLRENAIPGAKTGNFEDVFPEGFRYNMENVRKLLAPEYTAAIEN